MLSDGARRALLHPATIVAARADARGAAAGGWLLPALGKRARLLTLRTLLLTLTLLALLRALLILLLV